jgi:RNA polymerase subunit RPABC4/transcription elongation factor Spt4
VGIIRQANLETQLLGALDAAAMQQGAQVHVTNDSPFSPQTPPYPQSSSSHTYNTPPQSGPMPMPGYGQKQCPRCQTVNDADDAFCSQCGTALNNPKKVCANCKAELKADAAFCTRCGTAVAG